MTTAEQIELLRSRGMTVDQGLAEQWLSNVSYHRLSAYRYPLVTPAAMGPPDHWDHAL